MPFIDENKIAELYKEVDVLRNSSTYFQDLYLKSKKKISKNTFYKNLSIIVFLTLHYYSLTYIIVNKFYYYLKN